MRETEQRKTNNEKRNMTVSHRAVPALATQALRSTKVARLACCCKLADLLPLVQQLHREAALANAARAEHCSEAA